MPWEGYNYEDAFIISERLIYDDLYTSLHIEKFEIEFVKQNLGLKKLQSTYQILVSILYVI